MRIWRIGTKWGKIDLISIFKKHELAFAGLNIQGLIVAVLPGDLICITKGQSIEAIGKVEIVGDLATINPSLASQFAHVKALVLNELFFLKDFPFTSNPYLGRGKQFHEARGTYREMIEGLYNEIQRHNVKMNIKSLLEYKKQIILQGPPGTGKTRLAKEIAKEMTIKHEISIHDIRSTLKVGLVVPSSSNYPKYTILEITDSKIQLQLENEKSDYPISFKDIQKAFAKRLWITGQKNGSDPYTAALSKYIFENLESEEVKLIQFHPSYSYEDFVRGIVVETNDEKQVEYKVVNKVLAEFAQKALENQSTYYVLIIDEINRANLPSVLGEMIYALEYRFDPQKPKETSVESMYSLASRDEDQKEGRILRLPQNLFLIGTMNTADRSVGHIDYAIRRRFAFVDVGPSSQPIMDVIKDPVTQKKALKLFDQVSDLFGKDYLNSDFKASEVQLGHSYFLAEDEEKLKLKLEYEIKPLLREYIKDGILKEQASTTIESLSF